MVLKSVDSNQSTGRTYRQWITAFIASTAVLSYGFQTGWMSPMTTLLQSSASPIAEPVTATEMSMIASALCFCAIVTTPAFSPLADSRGRRFAISVIAVCQAISWLVKLFATTSTHLIAARAIAGVASGGCFIVVPSYVKDISQDHNRGTLGSLTMLLQNIGILATYALGAYLEYHAVVWAVMWLPWVTLALIWCVPESPAFLVKKGRMEEAKSAIAFLRALKKDDKVVETELERLKCEENYYSALPPITFAVILKDECYRKTFTLIIGLITVHALCGTFAILTYAAAILASSGVTVSPELQSLSFPLVMIVGSVLSMGCVERFGRKPLFILTLVMSALSASCLACSLVYQHHGGTPPGWLPATTIVVSVFCYAAGILPLPYVIMAEMLNFQIRCKIMGVVVTQAWLLNFIQLIFFGQIIETIGLESIFFFYAGTNLLGAIMVLIALPETKGKTTEQIEDLFRTKKGVEAEKDRY